MERSSDLALVVNSRCEVCYANPAFLNCLKIEPEEILGRPYGLWVNQIEAERMARCCRHVEDSVWNGTYDVRFKRRNGDRRIIELSSTPLSNEGEPLGCLCIGRDVTELRMKERLLEGLQQADCSIVESMDLKETFRSIVKEATNHLGFDRADIWIYDPEKNKMQGSYGVDEAGHIFDQSHVFVDLRDFPAPCHSIMRGEIPYYSSNGLTEEPVLSGILKQLDADTRAMAIVPLRSEGTVLGFIDADNQWSGRPISAEEMGKFLSLGQQASLALAYSRLYEKAQYLAENLDRQVQLFCGVANAGRMVSDGGDLSDTVQEVIRQVRTTLGFDRAALWLYDPAAKRLQGFYGTNRHGEMTDERHLFYEVDKINKEWVAILKGESDYVFIEDYDRHYQSLDDLTDMKGVKQHLTVPLKAGGRIVGLLFADNLMTQRIFEDKTTIPALLHFGGLAASAILLRLETQRSDREAKAKLDKNGMKKSHASQTQRLWEVWAGA
jgi:PAS domain S-box-containing protein